MARSRPHASLSVSGLERIGGLSSPTQAFGGAASGERLVLQQQLGEYQVGSTDMREAIQKAFLAAEWECAGVQASEFESLVFPVCCAFHLGLRRVLGAA
jgi:hypothetical protein